MSQKLGLTTRFSITATSLGTRKDVLNRRVATDLGDAPEYRETNLVLTANNSGHTVVTAKRVFTSIEKFFCVHSDLPLDIVITNSDNETSTFTMQDFFVVTAAFASIEVINVSETDEASVTVVCA